MICIVMSFCVYFYLLNFSFHDKYLYLITCFNIYIFTCYWICILYYCWMVNWLNCFEDRKSKTGVRWQNLMYFVLKTVKNYWYASGKQFGPQNVHFEFNISSKWVILLLSSYHEDEMQWLLRYSSMLFNNTVI